MNTSLKNWINNHLFTKDHTKMNNKCCDESWWTRRNYNTELQLLKDSTKFLPGDATITERVYCIYHELSDKHRCYCGNHTTFLNFKSGYRLYCSLKCSYNGKERNEKIRKNSNVQQMLETTRKSNLEKYGVEYYFQTEEFKKKSIASRIQMYGDANYNNNEKMKKTNLERYGVEYTGQAKVVIDKIEETKNKKYPLLRDKEWLLEQNKTKSITEIAQQMGVTYRTVHLWYKKHNLKMNFFAPDFSKQQKTVYKFINEECGINNIKMNDRNVIFPKELDIYLPDFNLAIEYNGMFWHSENPTRHKEKLELCRKKGIKLLQFWDLEWQLQPEIVKSIIKSNLGLNTKIYARKCELKEIDNKSYCEFLEINHIQGKINSKIRLGLFYEERLVSVMGFSKSRFDKKYSHELIRFCNLLNHNVIGGFSKLLNYAFTHYDIMSIQTFADLRIFDGESYIKNGFTHTHESKPGYVYHKSGIVRNRLEMQKHKMKDILPIFDETLSEHENALKNGWQRVWDCGQRVLEIKK